MKVTTVGIDLAKQVFQIHGVDECGKAIIKKQLRRAQMAEFFINLPPCLVGMEACGSSHHWARKLQGMGHTLRLMAPQYVKPYVKTNKNDAADAEAICEAVGRPNMRFVPVKNIEQQSILAVHRACLRLGRRLWKKWSDNRRRSLVETKMHCFKRLGERVMARTFERQVAELHVRVAFLNRFTQLGRQATVSVAAMA
jgi:transposase